MILTRLDGSALFYRAHTPRWASEPLSGAGAANKGGRFNRAGSHTLYLAASIETAVAEYQQLASIMPPLTLVSYHVEVARVVDFRHGYHPESWAPLWQEWSCDWRRLALLEGVEPPSWVLGDQLRAEGHTGLLFPSHLGGGTNLLVYPDLLAPSDRLEVHDPDQALPRDSSSW